MARVKISRDGHELGEWDELYILNWLIDEQLLETDFFWRPGMREWRPLSTWRPPSARFLPLEIDGSDDEIAHAPDPAADHAVGTNGHAAQPGEAPANGSGKEMVPRDDRAVAAMDRLAHLASMLDQKTGRELAPGALPPRPHEGLEPYSAEHLEDLAQGAMGTGFAEWERQIEQFEELLKDPSLTGRQTWELASHYRELRGELNHAVRDLLRLESLVSRIEFRIMLAIARLRRGGRS